MLQWTVLIIVATGFFLVLHSADSCNEAVCGSIVSKCLLTQSCKCDLKNCTCCRECYSCLSTRYSECCSCVDMCPKPDDTGVNLGKQSYVEDFTENVPGLFHALTEQPDPQDRWISFSYPIEFDATQFSPKKGIKLHLQSSEQENIPIKPNATVINCTVAFMFECMGWPKCRSNCQSMGSSSFRWFHNGCCECVGDTCINYGMNEAKCLKCSDLEEELDEEYNMWGYDDQSLEEFSDEDMNDDISTTN